MLFLIRETLIVNWGRGNISVFNSDSGNKDGKSVANAVDVDGSSSPSKKATKKEK